MVEEIQSILYCGYGDVTDPVEDLNVDYVAVGNHPTDIVTLNNGHYNEFWSPFHYFLILDKGARWCNAITIRTTGSSSPSGTPGCSTANTGVQNSSSSSGVESPTVPQPGQSGQAADDPAVTQHEVVQPDAAQPNIQTIDYVPGCRCSREAVR